MWNENGAMVDDSLLGVYSISISFTFNNIVRGWFRGGCDPFTYKFEITYVVGWCLIVGVMGVILTLLEESLRNSWCNKVTRSMNRFLIYL